MQCVDLQTFSQELLQVANGSSRRVSFHVSEEDPKLDRLALGEGEIVFEFGFSCTRHNKSKSFQPR